MAQRADRASSASRGIMFRLTEHDYSLLCAEAFLRDMTPTEVARSQVVEHLRQVEKSEPVQRVVKERSDYNAQGG